MSALLELPEVHVVGTPEALGEGVGEAFRERIKKLVDVRLDAVAVYLAERGVSADAFVERGRACAAIAEKWDPQGYAEHIGIARAADVDPGVLYATTNMTDVRDTLAYPEEGHVDAEGCSTMLLSSSATADGRVWVGQTWDLNPEDIDYVVAVHRKPDRGPATWSVTCVGCLTLVGASDAGVAVGTNNIKVKPAKVGVGYLTILHRMIREPSAEAAARIVEAAPRSAAHIYWAADEHGGIELEASAHRTVRRTAAEGHQPFVVRTNHCVDAEHEANQGEASSASSYLRYERMTKLLDDAGPSFGLEAFKQTFADRKDAPDSISRFAEDGTGSATNACFIVAPATRRVWACRGPSQRGAWRELSF